MTNKDTQHALIRLLQDAGYSLIASENNYGFYDSLKEALGEDGQQSYVDSYNNKSSMLYKPINDTDDLFEGEDYFAHALIETWALSVISPFVDGINELLGNSILQVYLEGGVSDCRLCADLHQEELMKALHDLDEQDLSEIQDALSDWSNTCDYIDGIDVLEDAVKGAIKAKN